MPAYCGGGGGVGGRAPLGMIWQPLSRPDILSALIFLLCTPLVLSSDQIWCMGAMG